MSAARAVSIYADNTSFINWVTELNQTITRSYMRFVEDKILYARGDGSDASDNSWNRNRPTNK